MQNATVSQTCGAQGLESIIRAGVCYAIATLLFQLAWGQKFMFVVCDRGQSVPFKLALMCTALSLIMLALGYLCLNMWFCKTSPETWENAT